MGTTDHAIIENNIYEFLKDLFKDLFKMQEIEVRPELSAKDVVGWDSFKQVEITLALEEEFGVIIRSRDLNDLTNVGDLVKLVLKKSTKPASVEE